MQPGPAEPAVAARTTIPAHVADPQAPVTDAQAGASASAIASPTAHARPHAMSVQRYQSGSAAAAVPAGPTSPTPTVAPILPAAVTEAPTGAISAHSHVGEFP